MGVYGFPWYIQIQLDSCLQVILIKISLNLLKLDSCLQVILRNIGLNLLKVIQPTSFRTTFPPLLSFNSNHQMASAVTFRIKRHTGRYEKNRGNRMFNSKILWMLLGCNVS